MEVAVDDVGTKLVGQQTHKSCVLLVLCVLGKEKDVRVRHAMCMTVDNIDSSVYNNNHNIFTDLYLIGNVNVPVDKTSN